MVKNLLSFSMFWSITMFAQADEQAPVELEQITVTAPLQKSIEPMSILENEQLLMKMGHSIGDTLKQELGITSQSFGPGVGTPVIRGQSGTRVKVLANGMGSNDVSQLSPDHASSVEPLLAERIEVLRGPATLFYGSGVIGGVVNVIDNRIPGMTSEKPLGGAFEQRYDSVANESNTALKADGGKKHFAYHLDGFYRQRDNLSIGGQAIDVHAAQAIDPSLHVIQNSNGYIPSTNAHAISGSAGIALTGDPGFAGFSINRLENNYGVAPDGSGGGNVRIDLKQSKYDFKSELKNPFKYAEALRMRFGYTDYRHLELDEGEPGTSFSNKSYEGRLELAHQAIGPFKGSFGFQAVHNDFVAFNFSGQKTMVPPSKINNYGVFAVEAFDYGPIRYQLGARVEVSSINPQIGPNLSYIPVSVSGSGLWEINANHSFNIALTRSQRAPQIQELLSYGFHDATRSFEQGAVNLRKEISYNLDLGYRFKSKWLRAEFDLFHNWVNDYIYQQRTGQFVRQDAQGDAQACGATLDCKAVLQSSQANAIFKGFESKLIFPVLENQYGMLDLTLFGDYTRGHFTHGTNVPRMPPLRYGFQLDYFKQHWNGNLRLTRAEAQNYSGDHDTTTPGYLLLNIGAQYEIKVFQTAKLVLFAKGNNLLNENIRNSTSYLRNFSPEPGRGGEIGMRISY